MAWINVIRDGDAEGQLKKEYTLAKKRAGRIFQILQIQSLNPAALRDSMRLYGTVMHGPSALSRMQREMLATVTSRINHCHY